jgi:hypothetical protein
MRFLLILILAEVLLILTGVLFRVHPEDLTVLAMLLMLPFVIRGCWRIDVPGPGKIFRRLRNGRARKNRHRQIP